MQVDLFNEVRRQTEICNACRYCEGYCSVFPAMHAHQSLADADLTQLANLCHNCRGCYYACQYTAPHEFDLNLPQALAELRRDSWEEMAWPQPMARQFHDNATKFICLIIVGFAVISALVSGLGNISGHDFYAVLSHTIMISIFIPAAIFPLISLFISLRRYWKSVKGMPIHLKHIRIALNDIATMKDLAAGHRQGCNFEDEDRFSHARRHAHHALMYGFLLCLASTLSGTILHYIFNMPAPYPFWSLPKLLGVPGGIAMVIGTIYMLILKHKSARQLGDVKAWNSENAFIILLGFIALSGLLLWALKNYALMPYLLILHLGAVLAFFIVTPFSKMAHGFYRLAAIIRNAQMTK